MINSSDVSVVVQGPISDQTYKTIESIRHFLPESEIILSTWKSSDTKNLRVDKLILNEEPLSYIQHERTQTRNNLNKLLRSTNAGLRQVNTRYVLKIRSDMQIESLRFLKHYEAFQKKGKYSCLKSKILVPLLFSRYKYHGKITPFHVSDWFAFGLTQDVRKVFLGTKEVEEPAFTEYFLHVLDYKSPYGSTTFKMSPEQYITYEFYRRNFNETKLMDCAKWEGDANLISQQFIVCNFIVGSFFETGIKCLKYPFSTNERAYGLSYQEMINELFYRELYKEYCDREYQIPLEIVKYFSNINKIALKNRYQKHLNNFQKVKGLKKVEEFFSLIYCYIIYLLRNKNA